MREWTRVLCGKRAIACLLCLLALNLWLYVRQETPDTDRYTLDEYAQCYNDTLTTCETMDAQDASLWLMEQQTEAKACFSLYNWMENRQSDPEDDAAMRAYYQETYPGYVELAESGSLPLGENESYLRYEVYTQVLAQHQYIGEHADYLEQIRKNADDLSAVSLFSNTSSFAYRNIQKTLEDFSGVYGAVLTVGPDLAVTSLFKENWTDYSILLFEILLCVLLMQERKNGMWSMIHASAGGRGVLAANRIGILLVGAVVGCTVLLGGKTLAAGLLYQGADGMGRTIQSIAMFKNVPMVMTVGQFFAAYLAVKIAGTFLIGLCLWTLLSAISHTNLAFCAAALFLGVEYACFTLIPDSFALVPLRYVNLFSFVEYMSLFTKYLNINLFGLLIEGKTLVLILLPIIIAALITALLYIHAHKKPVAPRNFLLAFIDRIRQRTDQSSLHRRMVCTEYHKVLWHQKGLWLLAALIALQCFTVTAPPRNYQADDQIVAYYKAKLEGPVTADTLTYIEEERDRLEKELSRLQEGGFMGMAGDETAAKLQALSDISTEVERLISLREEQGINAVLVESFLYDALFSENVNNYQRETALTAMLFLVFLLSGIFAFERQSHMGTLLHTGADGRQKLWRTKMGVAFLLTAMVWAIIYGTEIWLAIRTYGRLHSLNAALQSLPQYSGYSGRLSIGAFLCILYLTRLMVMTAFSCCILLLSQLARKNETALILNTTVFLIPAALLTTGTYSLAAVSFVIPLGATELLPDNCIAYPVIAMIGIAVAIVGRILFCRKV